MTGLSTGRRSHTRPAISWHNTVASVRGSAHAADVGNQDAAGLRELRARMPASVAAVADGHGGERYVRSDVGARFAVDAALAQLQEALAETDLHADVLPQQFGQIVARWREAVLQDSARRPFTAEERRRAGTRSLDDDPTLAYGATLLVAVLCGADVAVAQLGDGDVLLRGRGRQPLHPMPFDERLVAGQTTSLCLPTATADARFAYFGEADDVDLVVLATDGYANSFADDRWWPTVVEDMAAFVDRHGPAALDGELGSWLAESAQVGGDDVTVAVLSRMPRGERALDVSQAEAADSGLTSTVAVGEIELADARAPVDEPPPRQPVNRPPARPLSGWTNPTLNETLLLPSPQAVDERRSANVVVAPGRPPAAPPSAPAVPLSTTAPSAAPPSPALLSAAAPPTAAPPTAPPPTAPPARSVQYAHTDHDTELQVGAESGRSGTSTRWWLYLALLVVVIGALTIGVLLIRGSGSTGEPTAPGSGLAPGSKLAPASGSAPVTPTGGDLPTVQKRPAAPLHPRPVAPGVQATPAATTPTETTSPESTSGEDFPSPAVGIASAASASTVPSAAPSSAVRSGTVTSSGAHEGAVSSASAIVSSIGGAASVGPQGSG